MARLMSRCEPSCGRCRKKALSKRSKQGLDSSHVLGAVASLSALECVRETLRLALEELGRGLDKKERPDFWELCWKRYIESQRDYKSGTDLLKSKLRQAGEDRWRVLRWAETRPPELRYGRQVELLREVFAQQYQTQGAQLEPVSIHALISLTEGSRPILWST
jgi:hypothetical protein